MRSNMPLAELQQYVRILILDDDVGTGTATKFKLQQAGYPSVHFTDNVEKAKKRLPRTNILLIDNLLNQGEDGVEITRWAKEQYGSKLDIIIYSGSVEEDLVTEAKKAGATAFLQKPLVFDHLALWVEETSKRIWLQKILDAIPDEIMVVDAKDFGRIHYVNNAKRKAFENNKCLINDYCYKRFEKRGDGTNMCDGCLTERVLHDNLAVRTYWEYTDWNNEQGFVDLHAISIRDEAGQRRAIIETARDRTAREKMEKCFSKIENEQNFLQRQKLFLDGFQEMGYKRLRFYQRVEKKGKPCYVGIDSRGMDDGFNVKSLCYSIPDNIPSRLIEEGRSPILFIVKKDSGEKWLQSRTYKFLYKVDPEYVEEFHLFSKDRWIDIPVIANNKIIAKVSVEPRAEHFVSSYDLEVLEDYAMLAGQAIANSQQMTQLQVNNETNEAIIKLSSKITKLSNNSSWMDYAVKKVAQVLDTGACSIFIFNEETQMLKKEASYLCDTARKHIRDDHPEEYLPCNYMLSRVFAGGKSIFKNNLWEVVENEILQDQEKEINMGVVDNFSNKLGEPLYNAMYVVLKRDRKKIGVIRLFNKRRVDFFGSTDFTIDDRHALQALAAQISVAHHNKGMLDEIKEWHRYKEFVTQEYSHTLKNLLQPVVLLARFLEKNPADKMLWELLSTELSRMKTTIQTMVKLVSNEAGNLQLQHEDVMVNAMLKEVAKPYSVYYKDKDMQIDLQLDDSIGTFSMDRTLIYDAVANLLDNAFKYAFDKSIVTVQSKKYAKGILLSVQDYGAIIPVEDHKKIFEEFYIGKRVLDKVYQLGLGLAYVKVVVEAHGGRVYVDPEFNDGAKIIIQLPFTT